MAKLKLSLSLTNPPRRVPIELDAEAPAKTLFEVASKATQIPLDNLKLVFRGRIIANTDNNSNVVDEFNLEDGSVIHCMGKPVEGISGAKPEVAASVVPTQVTPAVAPQTAAMGAGLSDSIGTRAAVTVSPLDAALAMLKNNHSVSEYKTGLETLAKLLSNVIQNPMEEKYRRVKKSNAVFHKRLGRLQGASEIMTVLGFQSMVMGENEQGEEYYVLTPSPEAWPKLLQSKEIIDQAFHSIKVEQNHQQQQQQGQHPSQAQQPFLNSSYPNPMNFPAGMGPDPSMMANLLSNPQALRDMIQNPAIQQMMQNHPYFANNPFMLEQMRMMANNPQMMEQVSRMLSDPSNLPRLNEMMQSANHAGLGGASVNHGSSNQYGNMNINQQTDMLRQFMTNSNNRSGSVSGINNNASSSSLSTPAAQNQTRTANHPPSHDSNDSEMTEEEMIAEAIARSLRER